MEGTGKMFHSKSLWSGRLCKTQGNPCTLRLNMQELPPSLFLKREIIIVFGCFVLFLCIKLKTVILELVPFGPGSPLWSSNRKQTHSSFCKSSLDNLKSTSYAILHFFFLFQEAYYSFFWPFLFMTFKLFPSHPVHLALGETFNRWLLELNGAP